MSDISTGLGRSRRADFHGNSEKMPARITPTQIGAIGEQIVAVQLVLASDGRFSPFLPVADDDGISRQSAVCKHFRAWTCSAAQKELIPTWD